MATRTITHSPSSESLHSISSAQSTSSTTSHATTNNTQRPRQFVLTHAMTPSPEDDYIFWHHCCQCETRLVINAWCIDCKHHRCNKCHL